MNAEPERIEGGEGGAGEPSSDPGRMSPWRVVLPAGLVGGMFLLWSLVLSPWLSEGTLTLMGAGIGFVFSLFMGVGTWRGLSLVHEMRRRSEDQALELEQFREALNREQLGRRAAEAAATAWANVMEACPVALVSTDADGFVEFVNDRYLALQGIGREDALRERISLMDEGILGSDQRRALQKALRGGDEWRGDFWGLGASGQRLYLDTAMAPVSGVEAGRARFLFAIEDVTDKKRLQEQFLQSQKMEIIGRLAGGVVHDLSNMLTVIMGFAQIVQCSLEEDHELREEVDEIVQVTERASTLNRQLLTFARTRAHQAERVELDAAIQDLDKFLQRTLGEDVALAMDLHAGAAAITIDPGQFNQLLMNLAVNARDAMPQGGELTVVTRLADLPVDVCREHELKPGQYIRMAVRDTGMGMTSEVCEKLFEPFFTTKAEGKGTGLGLSTVREIVSRFGGMIEVQSALGKGSEFIVHFPTCRTGSPKGKTLSHEEVPGGEGLVLVVEDDDDVRRLTVALMKGLGYTVMEASSGREALSLCTVKAEQLKLVVSDVIMPEMDGIELARKLRTLIPHLGIVLVTGFSEHPIVDGASTEHFDCILQKPFNRAALATSARQVLDKERDSAFAPA